MYYVHQSRLKQLCKVANYQTFYFLSWWEMYSPTSDVSMTMNVLRKISIYLTPYKVIGLTWFLGLLMASPPLLGWAYYGPEPSGLG